MSKNFKQFSKAIWEKYEVVEEENKPTNPELWARAKSMAKKKFDVYPSAYANGWASKWYKSKGGGWKSVSEAVEPEKKDEYDGEVDMAKNQLKRIVSHAQHFHDMLTDKDQNLPEWVQSKITKAEDYISTAHDYMMGEMQEETILESLGNHGALTNYANSSKAGIDKKDFHTAAKYMKAGQLNKLKSHLANMDTDPRDHVIKHIDKKHHKALGYHMTEAVVRLDPKSFLKVKGPSSAYDAGYTAAKSGKKYGENPHPKGSKEHLDWSKAHNQARANKIHGEEVDLEEANFQITYKNPQFSKPQTHTIKAKNADHAQTKFLSYGNPYKVHSVKKVNEDTEEHGTILLHKYHQGSSEDEYGSGGKDHTQHAYNVYHKKPGQKAKLIGDTEHNDHNKTGKTAHAVSRTGDSEHSHSSHDKAIAHVMRKAGVHPATPIKHIKDKNQINEDTVTYTHKDTGAKMKSKFITDVAAKNFATQLRSQQHKNIEHHKEEVEQIDEISKQTAHSYVKKGMSGLTGMAADRALTKDRAERDELNRKIKNRKQGLSQAVNKLAQEESEQLDELSPKTLGSYAKKAAQSLSWNAQGYAQTKEKRYGDKMSSRIRGISKAANKLSQEDAEVPALLKKEGYYKDIATNKAEDERLAKQKKTNYPPHMDELLKKARAYDKKHPLPKNEAVTKTVKPGQGYKMEEAAMPGRQVAKHKDVVVHHHQGVGHVYKNGKKIASGDYDELAGGYFMSKPGEKGQRFFDNEHHVAKHYAESIEESALTRVMSKLKDIETRKSFETGQSRIPTPDERRRQLSKRAQVVKEAAKKKKQKPETFEAEPELTSDVQIKGS